MVGFKRIFHPLFVGLLMLFLTNSAVLAYMLKFLKNKRTKLDIYNEVVFQSRSGCSQMKLKVSEECSCAYARKLLEWAYF